MGLTAYSVDKWISKVPIHFLLDWCEGYGAVPVVKCSHFDQ